MTQRNLLKSGELNGTFLISILFLLEFSIENSNYAMHVMHAMHACISFSKFYFFNFPQFNFEVYPSPTHRTSTVEANWMNYLV